ncbi:MAG: hypothetical protein AB1391_03910 [Candidatus Micrarchaeota archaeon]
MKFQILFFFLMSVTSIFAFNITQYLTVNETNATIEYESFTIDYTNISLDYYIVNINKKPTFLIKTENISNKTNETIKEIVLNRTEIENALKVYYQGKYFINATELNSIKPYLVAFNLSRNNGVGSYKNMEENFCRQSLFLDSSPCIDDESCLRASAAFCILARKFSSMGCANQYTYLNAIKDFSFSSYGIDKVLSNITNKLNTIDEYNPNEYLKQIKNEIKLLKNYTFYIENTEFRIPLENQTCANCSGICVMLDLDTDSLDSAEKIIDKILSKIAQLSQYKLNSEIIFNNTQLRIQQSLSLDTMFYYNSTYASLKLKADKVRNLTNQALALIDNETAKLKLSQLSILEAEIESIINTNNFTLINDSLANYTQIIDSLNFSLNSTIITYYNISEAYKDATIYMFFIDGKALTLENDANRNSIKQTKTLLDQQFKKGLNASTYNDLKTQYEILISDEKALLSKTNTTQIFYLLTGISGNIIKEIDAFMVQAGSLTHLQKTQLSSYLPFGVSLVFFFSFLSAILFVFFIYYALIPKPINKILIAIFIMFLIFLIGMISICLFFSTDKMLNKMEYSDYFDLIKRTKNMVITIPQKNNIDNQTYTSMKTCALSIIAEFTKKNISSSFYEVSSNECIAMDKNNTTIKNCLDKNTKPIIMLNVSSITSVSYSGLITKQMNIFGDSLFYEVCPFAEILKIS